MLGAGYLRLELNYVSVVYKKFSSGWRIAHERNM